MANAIKHVGRHDNKKVAIVYKQVPDEDHMALVIYTETLPSMVHDEIMKVIESDVGQQAPELADALFRTTMADGNNCLTYLHKHAWLKKVQTKQVIVTVNAKSAVRLDELNKILNKMKLGEEAIKEMAEIDANRGITGKPRVREGRDVGMPDRTTEADLFVNTATPKDVLSDSDLALARQAQAIKMENEAKAMLAEAKRLKDEAKSLAPAKAKNVRATKKATA